MLGTIEERLPWRLASGRQVTVFRRDWSFQGRHSNSIRRRRLMNSSGFKVSALFRAIALISIGGLCMSETHAM
jgi:hypothetical protein